MKRKKQIIIITCAAILAVGISLTIIFWPNPSSGPENNDPTPNDTLGAFEVVLHEDGTLGVQADFTIYPEDSVYIYWETDAGNLESSTDNEQLLEIKARYDRNNTNLFHYGTYDDVVTWSPFDNLDEHYYQTVTVLAHIEHTRDATKVVFNAEITITYVDGTIKQTESRQMGNPIRANGDTDWVQLFPWSLSECDDGLLQSNTFVIRTGASLDDDYQVYLTSLAIPIWDSLPQVFGVPVHDGHSASHDEMLTMLQGVRLATIYFPANEHTGHFDAGEFTYDIDDWSWDIYPVTREFGIDDLYVHDIPTLVGDTIYEESLFVMVINEEGQNMLRDAGDIIIMPGEPSVFDDVIYNNISLDYALNHQKILPIGYVPLNPPQNEEPGWSGGWDNIPDIDAISVDLCVATHNINDFSFLSEYQQMTHLTLRDITFDASESSAIENLNLSDLVEILAKLPNLQELTFTFIPLDDISSLAGLHNIGWLTLFNTEITDISALGNLTNLHGLNLHRNHVEDITPLAELTQLYALNLTGNPVADIGPLMNMTALRELDLSEIHIFNFSPLKNLVNLEWLAINSGSIEDISSLTSLQQLRTLYLNWNYITDVSPLVELTNLEFLSIENNPVVDWSPLNRIPNLTLER